MRSKVIMSIVYINVPFFSTLVSGFVPEKTSPSSIILSAPSFLYASHLSSFFSNSVLNIWKEREGGREGGREGVPLAHLVIGSLERHIRVVSYKLATYMQPRNEASCK